MVNASEPPLDRARIAAAIKAAETATSGEIYCVLARSSGGYFFAAAVTLAVGLMAISLAVALYLDWMWISVRPLHFAGAQALAYATALLVVWRFPGLRIRLVPRRVLYREAHANALKQFLAHNVHLTEARTGVLLFVSLAERYAEIVADAGIDARVPQQRWNETVAALTRDASGGRLTEGFVAAIEAVGGELARHFPWRKGDTNELDDHLVEI